MRTALAALALIALPTLAQAEFRESSPADIAYWSGRVADTPAKCQAKMAVWARTSKLRLEPEDCEYGPKAPAVAQDDREPSQAEVTQRLDRLHAYMRRLEAKADRRRQEDAIDRQRADLVNQVDRIVERDRRSEAEARARLERDYPERRVLIDIQTGEPRYAIEYR